MNSDPRITTLAASGATGSESLTLCTRAEIVHHITLEPDTPYEETIRAWECFGRGPYTIRLGYGKEQPLRLYRAHPAGSVVRIEAVSPELAAARQKAALGLCVHPEAVPVHTLDSDQGVVAWLCPNCDEMLPPDWGLA